MADYLRDARTVSLATLMSRVLGLVRDSLTAAVLGMGLVSDAFFFAFQIPNLFRRLFGEGALSGAFIPIYTAERKEETGRATTFLNDVLGRMGYFFLCVVIAGVLLSLLGIQLLNIESVQDWLHALKNGSTLPEWLRVVFELTAIMLPYAALICMVAILAAALNVHRIFFAPALMPSMLNLSMIFVLATAFGLKLKPEQWIDMLALSVVAAGVIQFIWLGKSLKRQGVALRPLFQVARPQPEATKLLWKRMAPAVLGLSLLQLNAISDSVIAKTFINGDGNISVLYYVNRLLQFPLALLGIAVATAIFPQLAEDHLKKDQGAAFKETFGRGFSFVVFLALPSALGLIALSEPILRALFERGKFTPEDTHHAALVMAFGGPMVLTACCMHLITKAYHSTGNTKRPAQVAGFMVFLNVGLSLAFVGYFQAAGLILSSVITSGLNASILFFLLRRKVGRLDLKRRWPEYGRTLLASAIMFAALLLYREMASEPLRDLCGHLGKWVDLATGLTVGALAFFIPARMLRHPGLEELKSLATRKKTGLTRSREGREGKSEEKED